MYIYLYLNFCMYYFGVFRESIILLQQYSDTRILVFSDPEKSGRLITKIKNSHSASKQTSTVQDMDPWGLTRQYSLLAARAAVHGRSTSHNRSKAVSVFDDQVWLVLDIVMGWALRRAVLYSLSYNQNKEFL